MTNRLLKRHKRQVSRAKARVRVSEPDLRTPEQLNAAREASSAVGGRRTDTRPLYARSSANRANPATTRAVKADEAL
jgi:hypothetical protein